MSLEGHRSSNRGLRGPALLLGGVAAAVVAALVIVNLLDSRHLAFAQGRGLSGPDIDVLQAQNRAVERIAQAVTPAVVSIQTTQIIKVEQSPFFNDPFFRQFFGDMFGNIPREQREHALGSGVIVTSDGYIVTNNHVIAKASDIEVLLSDKRSFKGKVVGADPQTDVAVVKISGHNLPTAMWGDSAELHVGDSVMAFGNPFGLNFTVTKGIVSAVGRSGLGIESYEDFIQTDAAINPGNSGGALVDVQGRVVGINTAILSTSGGAGGPAGFNGVGLAIPANIARQVMESLVKTGKVERGYLGVTVSDLDEKLARQFKVPDLSGALVQDVAPGSPAEKAGLKQGDVIRSLDGKTVQSKDSLTFGIASLAPGSDVSVDILREGRHMTLRVRLEARPENLATTTAPGQPLQQGTLQGIAVQNLTPEIRRQLQLPSGTQGVVVAGVDPASPAGQEGLQEGDVIQAIDRQRVRSVADFDRLAANASGEVLLRVLRQGTGLYIVISPPEQ